MHVHGQNHVETMHTSLKEQPKSGMEVGMLLYC